MASVSIEQAGKRACGAFISTLEAAAVRRAEESSGLVWRGRHAMRLVEPDGLDHLVEAGQRSRRSFSRVLSVSSPDAAAVVRAFGERVLIKAGVPAWQAIRERARPQF